MWQHFCYDFQVVAYRSDEKMKICFILGLFFTSLLGAGFEHSATTEPDIPSDVARKFKRDASRLALRLHMQDDNLRHLPINIASGNTEKIYRALCQIYSQTELGKRLERCNIHTFPDPSIDHMVVIYRKQADWAGPLQKGLMQTNSGPFNALVSRYKLVLEKHVLWTATQNAITLRATEPLNMAALAKEFLQIEGVQEIDLGIPKTPGNDILVRRNTDSWDFEYVLRFGAWNTGKGESHSWYFQVSDQGKVQSQGDTGAQVPNWLKCRWEQKWTRNFQI